MVLGQHDGSDAMAVGVPSDFVESVLLTSGKPGSVLPFVGTWHWFGQHVLVAWNGTRESAQAVSAAIPFSRRAKHIHLTIAEGELPVDEQCAELEDHLRTHNIAAPIYRHATLRSDFAGKATVARQSG